MAEKLDIQFIIFNIDICVFGMKLIFSTLLFSGNLEVDAAAQNGNNRNILHYAAFSGNVGFFNSFFETKPLHKNGKLSVAKFLMQKDRFGLTPFALACAHVVVWLMRHVQRFRLT